MGQLNQRGSATVASAPVIGATTAQRAGLLALIIALTCLSQFYRVSNSVIAPELMRELGLSARDLGLAGAVFFMALFVLQIPVGMWFDRYGPRRTVAALSVFAIAGALLVARAGDAFDLIAARGLIGLGCAASFMAAVFLCSRWFPPDRLSTVLSWVFAAANLGTLAAATPLAWASATIGWRNAFVGLAVLTALVALLFVLFVRDAPPGQPATSARRETLAEIGRGLIQVWRTPGLLPLLAVHLFAYATMLTVLGVWAGPYLHDVHGLDTQARGRVVLAMGVAQILGLLCYGPLDRVVQSKRRVVIMGVVLTMSVLTALAAIPHPPLWLAVGLLVTLCLVCAYAIVVVAQGRALFPDHLAGRGVTTVNLAQVAGLAILPWGTGISVDAFGLVGGVAPEAAYRAVFASLVACNLFGLTVYTARAPMDAPKP